MGVSTAVADAAWQRGRFDARPGPSKVLFGRMYEDASIELGAFRRGQRVFCIASAGCTVQLAYAQRRIEGAQVARGVAERLMAFARAFAPVLGWWPARLRTFLDLEDPKEQVAYWRRHLDNRRFRAAFDGLLSLTALRAVYASPLLSFLPAHFGALMRGRMERCFARHSNRGNPYARALLLGALSDAPPPPQAREIRLVHADAATCLEAAPAGSFHGFALSNILDGADRAYERRLIAAVKRAAAPDAVSVVRSFREARIALPTNRAADDRAMLWGVVDVRPAARL